MSEVVGLLEGYYPECFKEEFEAKLEALCRAYDAHYGSYPEIEFQGLSLYEFFLARLGEGYHWASPERKLEWYKSLDTSVPEA